MVVVPVVARAVAEGDGDGAAAEELEDVGLTQGSAAYSQSKKG